MGPNCRYSWPKVSGHLLYFFFEVCRRQNIRPYLCYGESEALQATLASRLALDLQLRFTGLHIQEQEMVQNGNLIAAVFNI